MNQTPLSRVMKLALGEAAREPLKRTSGGNWVPMSFEGDTTLAKTKYGQQVIDDLEERGLLEPMGDYPEEWRQSRQITDLGRSMAKRLGV